MSPNPRNARALRTATLALAIVLFPAVAFGASPPSGALRPLTVSTSAHQPVVTKTVDVRVSSSTDLRSLDATVGGINIAKRFHSAGAGRWVAALPVGKVLKPGVNRVFVVARGAKHRRGAGSLRIIVAKRGGTAGSVRIARLPRSRSIHLKLARAAVLLSLRLNGQKVTGLFDPASHGAQQARISPVDGLKYGRNVLVTKAALRDGRSIRRKIVFRVPRTAPLASAGRDRRIKMGQTVRLDAGKSRSAKGALGLHWRIKRAPAGSKAKLSGAQTRRPSLTADKHGRYELELTASGSGGSSVDVATIDAIPQYPRIGASLNTAAPQPGGGYALEIGANCVNSNQQNCPHVVVPYDGSPVLLTILDRSTLELEGVERLPNSPVGGLEALTKLVAIAGNGSPTSMAILSAVPNAGTNPSLFVQALGTLNGVVPRFGSALGWAAIGVPVDNLNIAGIRTGFSNGGIAPVGDETLGSLNGYLQYQYATERYGFQSGKSSSYDTSTAASTASVNVMRVGDATYPSAPLPAGCSGAVHMVVVRAATLAAPGWTPANQTYATNCSDQTAMDQAITDFNGAIGAVGASVDIAGEGPMLAFVQTVGQPFPLNPTQNELNLLSGIANSVEELGGTDEAFNDAIGTQGASYALAGSSSLLADAPPNQAGQAFAPEATTLQAGNGGSLDGILKYDRYYAYQPISGASNLTRTGFWTDLASQPAQAWPYSSKTGEKNALAYISKKYEVKYSPASSCYQPVRPDVRFEYCDLSKSWSSLKHGLNTTPNAPAGCGCTNQEWTNVSGEIVTEIGWVLRLRGFVKNVQRIYGTASNPGKYNISSLSSEVETAVNPPANGTIWGSWLGIVGDIANAVAIVPTDETFGSTINAISALSYVFADAMSEANGAQTLGEMVGTVANELPSELASRYLLASEQFGELSDVIVTDYGKLSVAGSSTQSQIDNQTIDDSISQLQIGGYRFAYKRLLGVAYNSYGLPYSDLSPNANTPQDYVCYAQPGYYNKVKPFNSAGQGGWITQNPNNPGIGVYGGDGPTMLALGLKDYRTAIEVKTPPSSLVLPMTQPITFSSTGVPVTFGEYAPWWFRHDFAQRLFQCNN